MKTLLLPVRVETVKQIVLNWSLESRGQVFQYKKRIVPLMISHLISI